MLSFRALQQARCALSATSTFRPRIQTASMASRAAQRAAELQRNDEEFMPRAEIIDNVADILETAEPQPVAGKAGSFEASLVREEHRKQERFRRVSFVKPSYWADEGSQPPTYRRKRWALGPSSPVSRAQDAFHQLNVDPLVEATNPLLMTDFVTVMGKTKSRAENKVTWRTQRRITKAVRRAKMMGVVPILYRQPTPSISRLARSEYR
ncbi:hypothetical protein FA95DRAFT_1552910 [Auriscalpium vulgare]|uniref:Uncharacterized protein n=1 Tax=Auriscalpium vulgare TaxID=40419 RepID=A0ACB8SA68_9AGAM|nr:hypothetical protein FA95DRAFT_1552910 [Auriscalpium vulgare]